MTGWPRLNRSPVDLLTLSGQPSRLWETLVDLTEVRPGHWTLIGAQMVLLHALEHGATPPRVSTDLDVLVNARVVAIPDFVSAVEALGFDLVGTSTLGIAHRYSRDGVSIDILAPDNLGSRASLVTTPPGGTLEVPGGTQALNRTELLPVRIGAGTKGFVPRPSLLGSIVGKALAVDVDDAPGAQRQDFVFLLALVDDPMDLAAALTAKDRQRLRTRSELDDSDHPAWQTLPTEQQDRARATLAILSR